MIKTENQEKDKNVEFLKSGLAMGAIVGAVFGGAVLVISFPLAIGIFFTALATGGISNCLFENCLDQEDDI